MGKICSKHSLFFKSIVFLLTTLFFTTMIHKTTNVYASTSNDPTLISIENLYSLAIDDYSKIALYDSSDNIIAYCYNITPKGYIIIDSNTNEIIEYSKEKNNDYFKKNNEKYYYSGPLTRYKKTSSGIKDLSSNKIIDKKDISNKTLKNAKYQQNISTETLNTSKSSSSKNKEYYTYVYNSSYKYPNGFIKTVYLPYSTKLYSYNPNGICGSTASAIYFNYFYSHINKKYVSSSLITNSGIALIKKLKSYIEPKTPGSSYSKLTSGINSYLSSKKIKNVMKYITKYNILTSYKTKITSCINSSKPCIIGLSKHPKYGEHWVVCHGYEQIKSPSNSNSPAIIAYAIINDGWGAQNIYVNMSYIDGVIYMS